MSHETREIKAQKSEYFSVDLKARLTVICSSTTATIYSLDEKKFFSLSDNLQKVILDGIMESVYFDEKDFESKINAQR